jgi:hypothetical protein
LEFQNYHCPLDMTAIIVSWKHIPCHMKTITFEFCMSSQVISCYYMPYKVLNNNFGKFWAWYIIFNDRSQNSKGCSL